MKYANMSNLSGDQFIWNDICKNYCPRCVLRLLCHDWSLIRKTEADIVCHLTKRFNIASSASFALSKDENQHAVLKQGEFCCACLGTLQSIFLHQCVSYVADAVAEKSYHFTSYQMMVHMPMLMMLSEHYALIHFKDRFGIKSVNENPCVKEVFKTLLEPLLCLKLKAERKVNAEMEISVHITHSQADEKILPQLKMKAPQSFQVNLKNRNHKQPKHQASFTCSQIKSALTAITATDLMELCSMASSSCDINIKLLHSPVYVAGRYNKYSRTLPQTPWFIDGIRKIEGSVQEYLAQAIEKAFLADGYNFSSSGREDVDVRMLGNGRPFLIELVNPKSTIPASSLQGIEASINVQTPDVKVSLLQVVEKIHSKKLKEGEMEKTKSYAATCCFRKLPTVEQLEKLERMNKLVDVEINQKTPIRVLHRRTLSVRRRTIHSMAARVIKNEPFLFKLNLSTQAGTYIKEFVHGDFGRTNPSLRDFLNAEVDIIDLDVMSVDVKWPPDS